MLLRTIRSVNMRSEDYPTNKKARSKNDPFIHVKKDLPGSAKTSSVTYNFRSLKKYLADKCKLFILVNVLAETGKSFFAC